MLDARKVYDSGAETFSLSKERFFLVGELWVAVMEGEPVPVRSYNHVAFKIDEADYAGRAEMACLWLSGPTDRANLIFS